MIIITVETLRSLDACGPQVVRFRKAFGPAVVLTPENLRRAAAAKLQLNWAAERILKGDAKARYRAARAEPRQAFWVAQDDARRVYGAGIKDIWDRADRARTEARRVHQESIADASAAYGRACDDAHNVHWDRSTGGYFPSHQAAMTEALRVFSAAKAEPDAVFDAALADINRQNEADLARCNRAYDVAQAAAHVAYRNDLAEVLIRVLNLETTATAEVGGAA